MQLNRRLAALTSAAACAAAVLIGQSAHATDYSWATSASGSWSAAANWVPSTGSPVAGDTATFSAAGADGNVNVYLAANQAAASLTFSNAGTTTLNANASGTTVRNLTLTSGLTVNGGAGAVTIGNAPTTGSTGIVVTVVSGNVTFTNNSANTLTFDAGAAGSTTSLQGAAGTNTLTLAGSGNMLFAGSLKDSTGATTALVVNSTGHVELDGSGTQLNGGITLNSGTLGLRSAAALGTTTVTIKGGTLAAVNADRTIPAGVSFVLGGNATFGASGTAPGGTPYTGANLNLLGPIDLGGQTRTLTFANATTFGGAITNGGITKNGTGNLTLGTATTARHTNTFAGDTTVNAGTLTTVNSYGTSENSRLVLKNGTTFDARNGGSQDIGSLSDGGTANSTAQVQLGNVSADVLAIGWDGTNSTFSGKIVGADPNFNGGITKVGTGTLALTGANIYNGVNRVSGGTLQINSIANGAVVLPAGSFTPVVGQNTLTVPSVAGIAVGMVFNDTNNIPSGTTVTAVDAGTNTVTFSSTFTAAVTTLSATIGTPNSLGISSAGAGSVILDGGSLQYTGPAASTDRLFTLTASGGALDASGTGALTWAGNGSPSAIALSGTGARTLTLAGTNAGANTLAPVVGENGGATSVMKAGPGQWVLTGANTYTGVTTVEGGTLVLGPAAWAPALSAAGADVKGGKLVFDYAAASSPAGSVFSQIAAGAIKTSSASATVTVGMLDDGASKVTVMATYYGDANLDGRLNADDYALIDRGFAKGLTGWVNGDFNYSGAVDSNDYLLIDATYGASGVAHDAWAALLAERQAQFGDAYVRSLIAAVPEPATVSLLALGGVSLLSRRRRAGR